MSNEPAFPSRFGDAVLRIPVEGDVCVLTTTARLAGAIHSFQWKGQEYIDSTDHGRQLQSACAFDCGFPGEFWAEAYNPTEAGSRSDHIGEKSTSQLLEHVVRDNSLRTRTRMAFWLQPCEDSAGRFALNHRDLSEIILTKEIRVGMPGLPQVLDYRTSFMVSRRERRHTFAQFEALTGYMPYEFANFFRFVPDKGSLEPLSDSAGEQAYPVVLSTRDGKHAMGVYSPDQPSPGFETVGYGRFRFPEARVVKWNCVFRVMAPRNLPTGSYSYPLMVPWGTLAQVEASLRRLWKRPQNR